MKRVAYIIPGHNESAANNPAYHKIASFFRKRGVEPIIIDVPWRNKTMSQYVDHVLPQISAKDGEFYLLGFSFGAMISFLISTRRKPIAQMLCSLSPYFSEDLPFFKQRWKDWAGKRRIEDFKNLSFDSLATLANGRTFILVGGEEIESVKRRVFFAHEKIVGSELVSIPHAKHDINSDSYLKAVEHLIDTRVTSN